MKTKRKIKWSSLPARSPVGGAILYWMLLDRLQAPGWAYGILFTIASAGFIVFTYSFWTESLSDVPGFGDDSQPTDAPATSRRGTRGAPPKEMLSGVETRLSIIAYKLWLQGDEQRRCEHDYQQDRCGPVGQYICTYCRDLKNQ